MKINLGSCRAEREIYVRAMTSIQARHPMSQELAVMAFVAQVMHRVRHLQTELSLMQVLSADLAHHSLLDMWGRSLSGVESSVESWVRMSLDWTGEQFHEELNKLGAELWPTQCAESIGVVESGGSVTDRQARD